MVEFEDIADQRNSAIEGDGHGIYIQISIPFSMVMNKSETWIDGFTTP